MNISSPIAIPIHVNLADLPPIHELEAMWRELEARANGSFFNSWSWIGAWLKTYAAEALKSSSLGLLIGRRDGRVVALGIIGRARRPQFAPWAKTKVLLHQTGAPDDAAAFIEYNGLLLDRTAFHDAQAAVFDFILHSPRFLAEPWTWTEFTISGAEPATVTALRRDGIASRTVRAAICPWVDLKALQPGLEGYLAALSANTRQQIRRAIRLFAQTGPLALTSASTQAEANALLQEMRQLHECGWRNRGKGAGAFSFPAFADFCAALIEQDFEAATVEVLRLAAGDTTLGILLNFVHRDQVYAYQSGLSLHSDNRLKPGLVAHALAIASYQERGFAGYHFMAGDGRYKSSLATATEELTWLVIRRDGPRARAEDLLRSIKQKVFSS